MPEDPLGENDELLHIARRYFSRLASRPMPRGLEPYAPFSASSHRSSRPRLAVNAVLAFAAVAAVLSLIVVGVGHELGARQGTPATSSRPQTSTANPVVSPPPGGPVPSVLTGDWVSPSKDNNPSDATDLILHGSRFEIQTSGGLSFGMVAVNGSEIDFFNGDVCRIGLPGGVGRYHWSVQGGILHLTPLNVDPCGGRTGPLANASYTKQGS